MDSERERNKSRSSSTASMKKKSRRHRKRRSSEDLPRVDKKEHFTSEMELEMLKLMQTCLEVKKGQSRSKDNDDEKNSKPDNENDIDNDSNKKYSQDTELKLDPADSRKAVEEMSLEAELFPSWDPDAAHEHDQKKHVEDRKNRKYRRDRKDRKDRKERRDRKDEQPDEDGGGEWRSACDKKGNIFFWNTRTRKRRWTKPCPGRGENWTEFVEPDTGRRCFWNPITGDTLKDKPSHSNNGSHVKNDTADALNSNGRGDGVSSSSSVNASCGRTGERCTLKRSRSQAIPLLLSAEALAVTSRDDVLNMLNRFERELRGEGAELDRLRFEIDIRKADARSDLSSLDFLRECLDSLKIRLPKPALESERSPQRRKLRDTRLPIVHMKPPPVSELEHLKPEPQALSTSTPPAKEPMRPQPVMTGSFHPLIPPGSNSMIGNGGIMSAAERHNLPNSPSPRNSSYLQLEGCSEDAIPSTDDEFGIRLPSQVPDYFQEWTAGCFPLFNPLDVSSEPPKDNNQAPKSMEKQPQRSSMNHVLPHANYEDEGTEVIDLVSPTDMPEMQDILPSPSLKDDPLQLTFDQANEMYSMPL